MRRLVLLNLILWLAVAAAAEAAGFFFWDKAQYIRTNQAQVGADLVVISTPEVGRLTQWSAKTGDRISAGAVLGTLQPLASIPSSMAGRDPRRGRGPRREPDLPELPRERVRVLQAGRLGQRRRRRLLPAQEQPPSGPCLAPRRLVRTPLRHRPYRPSPLKLAPRTMGRPHETDLPSAPGRRPALSQLHAALGFTPASRLPHRARLHPTLRRRLRHQCPLFLRW
ncbi:hypothetical protein [Kyrpidia spormannii]|uniref:Uncharacterized protein n=1 Tax=Kyrpidia spormannii TaxID=2055160 RepID=A0ACA8ZEG9_9BACL|nr:hypothetical protein [Kyrpidia spormannii]CAB3395414.1 conserved exported protein of unknown function [Kyrpidia spormannii]